MPWDANRPNVGDNIGDSLAGIRDNFQALDAIKTNEASILALAGDQAKLAALANANTEILSLAGEADDILSLALEAETLLDSRIVEHNLDIVGPVTGYYVRWENGLQMCWFRTGTLTADSVTGAVYAISTQQVFPVQFVDIPAITYGADMDSAGSGGVWAGSYYPASTGYVSLLLLSTHSGRSGRIMGVAIGAWEDDE